MSNDEKKKQRRRVSVAYGYRNNPDGSIEFNDDVPHDVRDKILEQHTEAMDRDVRRRELWGDIGPQSMTRLTKLFPSLREVPGVDPWDATELLDWLCCPAPTSGSTEAALFVLGVWNDQDWAEVAKDVLPKRQCNGCKRA